MKTRTTLALALGLATVTCTGAEAPPPRIGFWIQLQVDDTSGSSCGLDGNTQTVPRMNAPVAQISQFSTEAELEALELLRDGDDGASVSCKIKELGPGAYEIDVGLEDGAYFFELAATTANSAAANGSAGYKSPQTAGETIRSSACQVGVFQPREGGGAALVTYSCNGTMNPATPDRVCRAAGAFYARDCSR